MSELKVPSPLKEEVKDLIEEVLEGPVPFGHPSEFVPSTWSIQPHTEADCIHATNNVTGRIFLGALSVFNKLLRG
jgi:hypothetical protein